jgi:carboxylesterase type B
LYVPGQALQKAAAKEANVPVVVWIYGGAYVLGSKDLLYAGNELIKEARQNMIMVIPNYRVGAFGFLAGNTVEAEGVVNAGIHDQRAALEWTQKYISLVGGDSNHISAWGESAGAGSIMHHLIAERGTRDPIFKTAVLQSPAFHVVWDRNNSVQDAYKKFEKHAGCAGKGLACLRQQDYKALEKANEICNLQAVPGIFAFGPTPDGGYFHQVPSLEFKNGYYWKNLDSLIVSHTKNEGALFYPKKIKNDAQMMEFIRKIYPDTPALREIYKSVDKQYPGISAAGSRYKVESSRGHDIIAESTFTCNTRFLAEAYPNKTYSMQYSTKPGLHGTDLLALWYRAKAGGKNQHLYQSYYVSFGVSGNPNTLRAPGTPEWPLADASGEAVHNVLDANGKSFTLIQDQANLKSHCDWWLEEQANVGRVTGYDPTKRKFKMM